MRAFLIVLAGGLLISGPVSAAKDDVVYGYGLQDCKSFLKTRKKAKKDPLELEWLAYTGWLSGYFSGLNTQAIVGGAAARSVEDLDAYVAVVSKICKDDKSQALWQAGFRAFVALPEGEQAD